MKNKLQVEVYGTWLWVSGMNNLAAIPITTTSKRRAMPEKTYWCVHNIDIARKHCPDHTFRVASSLEE
jgi:hypothetical protein